MRNIGILIIIAIWILLGFKMCSDWNACCAETYGAKEEISEAAIPPPEAAAQCPDVPICFMDGVMAPKFGTGFPSFRDSVIASVGEGQKLRIIGTYGSDEKNTTTFDNLGLYRADFIKNAFAEVTDVSNWEIGAQQLVGQASANQGVSTERIRFSVVGEEEEPLPSGTLIYFPFNSTNRINDPGVEDYLNKLAERIKDSGEKVRLVGHTDNIGGDSANMRLGRQRAVVVRDYLMSKGIPSSSLLVESRGESRPVALNTTERGRAQNRRTELQIIK